MKLICCTLVCLQTALFSSPSCENPSPTPPSEEEQNLLFSQINSESRRLYNSLDCEGKKRAVELSPQFRDKNRAIQQAAKEMAVRQRAEFPNQDTYQKQEDDLSGQDEYNNQFGY